jgi:hypothetical protein
MNPEAKSVSFVLRFVYEEPLGEVERLAGTWYSVVRHVQSNTERHFTRWDDVVAFIEDYVNLNRESGHD